ncbi:MULTISPECIES: hypothetical protein [unclassified Synechococcus]|nr:MULTISPECIES: hypothetical protein [unclassified Synechococcus]EAQ74783.1 hypothetical protein WH5701_11249 [Synechococcus sp. WH 5701]WFN58176.1 hypothetical protein N4320_10140 [Synechococcus sp. CCFWC 502]
MTERAEAPDGKKTRRYLQSRLRIGSNVGQIPQTVAEAIGRVT